MEDNQDQIFKEIYKQFYDLLQKSFQNIIQTAYFAIISEKLQKELIKQKQLLFRNQFFELDQKYIFQAYQLQKLFKDKINKQQNNAFSNNGYNDQSDLTIQGSELQKQIQQIYEQEEESEMPQIVDKQLKLFVYDYRDELVQELNISIDEQINLKQIYRFRVEIQEQEKNIIKYVSQSKNADTQMSTNQVDEVIKDELNKIPKNEAKINQELKQKEIRIDNNVQFQNRQNQSKKQEQTDVCIEMDHSIVNKQILDLEDQKQFRAKFSSPILPQETLKLDNSKKNDQEQTNDKIQTQQRKYQQILKEVVDEENMIFIQKQQNQCFEQNSIQKDKLQAFSDSFQNLMEFINNYQGQQNDNDLLKTLELNIQNLQQESNIQMNSIFEFIKWLINNLNKSKQQKESSSKYVKTLQNQISEIKQKQNENEDLKKIQFQDKEKQIFGLKQQLQNQEIEKKNLLANYNQLKQRFLSLEKKSEEKEESIQLLIQEKNNLSVENKSLKDELKNEQLQKQKLQIDYDNLAQSTKSLKQNLEKNDELIQMMSKEKNNLLVENKTLKDELKKEQFQKQNLQIGYDKQFKDNQSLNNQIEEKEKLEKQLKDTIKKQLNHMNSQDSECKKLKADHLSEIQKLTNQLTESKNEYKILFDEKQHIQQESNQMKEIVQMISDALENQVKNLETEILKLNQELKEIRIQKDNLEQQLFTEQETNKQNQANLQEKEQNIKELQNQIDQQKLLQQTINQKNKDDLLKKEQKNIEYQNQINQLQLETQNLKQKILLLSQESLQLMKQKLEKNNDSIKLCSVCCVNTVNVFIDDLEMCSICLQKKLFSYA
ncbi:hypothetical protein ABPG72_005400 [Tetrahymena utriculariae]